jgi:hypothetical protein
VNPECPEEPPDPFAVALAKTWALRAERLRNEGREEEATAAETLALLYGGIAARPVR